MIKLIIDQEHGGVSTDNKLYRNICELFQEAKEEVEKDRSTSMTIYLGSELGFIIARSLIATKFVDLHAFINWFVLKDGEEVAFKVTKNGRAEPKAYTLIRSYWDESLELILSCRE